MKPRGIKAAPAEVLNPLCVHRSEDPVFLISFVDAVALCVEFNS